MKAHYRKEGFIDFPYTTNSLAVTWKQQHYKCLQSKKAVTVWDCWTSTALPQAFRKIPTNLLLGQARHTDKQELCNFTDKLVTGRDSPFVTLGQRCHRQSSKIPNQTNHGSNAQHHHQRTEGQQKSCKLDRKRKSVGGRNGVRPVAGDIMNARLGSGKHSQLESLAQQGHKPQQRE